MLNKCVFCNQEFNKDYERKCPTCGRLEDKKECKHIDSNGISTFREVWDWDVCDICGYRC